MKKVTKKIILTIDEWYLFERERYPFKTKEKTPVMDKIRRAGIDPTAGDLMIEQRAGADILTLFQERYEMDKGERIYEAYRSTLHYFGIIPSPTRAFLGYRTLKGDIRKIKKMILKNYR